jgi:peptidoglycan hydrolase CwlO-like protein
MKQKKFVRAVCIFLAVLILLSVVMGGIASLRGYAVSRAEIDALERQKAAITEQKNAVSVRIAGLKGEQASVIEQKSALDEQNTLAMEEIELINEQIEIYDGLIEETKKELAAAIDRENYQKERFRMRMRAMEENGDLGYIAFIFQATSFSDLLTRMDNVSEIMESDQTLEQKYIAAREQVEVVKAEYEAVQAEQLQKRDELEQRKAELEAQIAEAIALITELQKDIDSYTAEYAENEARGAGAPGRYPAPDRGVQRGAPPHPGAATAATATAADQSPAPDRRQYHHAAPAQTTVTVGTGSFQWPATSRVVTSPFGTRIHPIFQTEKYHAGIDIGAAGAVPSTPPTAAPCRSLPTAPPTATMWSSTTATVTPRCMPTRAPWPSPPGTASARARSSAMWAPTGWVTAAQLHFEMTLNGARVDPESYFTGLTKAY